MRTGFAMIASLLVRCASQEKCNIERVLSVTKTGWSLAFIPSTVDGAIEVFGQATIFKPVE